MYIAHYMITMNLFLSFVVFYVYDAFVHDAFETCVKI